MTDFFDGRSGIGVHQKRKVFELRNQYTLTDEAGADAGRVEQAKQSALTWLARLGTSIDTMLPTTLAVTDASARRVLVLEKPWFKWTVTVRDSDGRTIGVIGRKLRVGKPVYTLTAHGGAEVGEIRAQDWRSRKFEVVDTAGMDLGQVTKQWRGLFAEVVTDADSYAVTFEPQATSDQRALTFAGALTVDLIQKQKDTGGGIGDLIGS
ncbi:MAG TPA: phospholipid scramblase-related protein [Acidimicrobiales bacterium]|nr:phospholipid scramblase-related protein [Acidimicrobiales bacterium]